MNSKQINQAKFSEITNKKFQSSGMEFYITQRFDDPETIPSIKKIYTDYGRKGHDGLDLVVLGDVRAVESGEVFYAGWDTDLTWSTKGMFNGFGIMTVIWNKENNSFWVYAHLASNIGVEVGQKVNKGDFIGKMGGSGRGKQGVWAVHLHLGLYKVNNTPTILDRDNGFWGGIDPLPYLIDNILNTPSAPVIIQTPTQIPSSQVNKDVITNPQGFDTASSRYQKIYQNKDWVAMFRDFKDRDDEISNLKNKIKELEDSNVVNNQTISDLRETIGIKEGQITTLGTDNYKANLEIKRLNGIISQTPEPKSELNSENTFSKNQNYSQIEKEKIDHDLIENLTAKPFYNSKKFLYTVLSIGIGAISVYFKLDIQLILLFMAPSLTALGLQGGADIQIATSSQEFFKSLQKK